ncbi:MAG TPA: putative baseplate assembly protein, partial [Anaerolineae bacterium]|nr:putative baseplate assembly protein [Anaerolineae bacterium]
IPIDETSDLYRNFRRALQLSGETYQPIVVQQRALSLLVVSAIVQLLPDYAWEFVAPQIRSTLLDTFSFERRELGQDVTSSEVISTIQAVEGVAYVDLEVLDDVDEERLKNFITQNGEQNDTGQVIDHFNLALRPRLSPAMATFDSASRQFVPAQLIYLDPNLPDTLLLTELST